MTPNPVLIKIGPITVYWYGFLIVIGAMLAAWTSARIAEREGQDPEHVWNALILCLLFGVLGARLYHVISSWEYYVQHPGEIIGFNMAGFGIYGAILGGMLGLYIYTRWNKLRFLRWADYAIVGVPLAQAIGRWGNFFNQELYGYPTNLPWGIYIDPAHRLPGFEAYERFHPTFFYEFLWNLLTFGVLLWISLRHKKKLFWGDLLLFYCILYPFGRFFVEFQRPDAWKIWGIPTAQIVAIASIAISGTILILRHYVYKRGPRYSDLEAKPSEERETSEGGELNGESA